MSATVRSWRAEIACLHVLLRRQREALGMTQQQVADRLGVEALAVSQWENSHANPSIARLWEWADVVGVQIVGSVREVCQHHTSQEAA